MMESVLVETGTLCVAFEKELKLYRNHKDANEIAVLPFRRDKL